MLKILKNVTYVLTITLAIIAVAIALLGLGFLFVFVQGLIGGTILYFSYPFIQSTLFPSSTVGSLYWLDSVLLLITVKAIFGAGISVKKDYYTNLIQKFKELKAELFTNSSKSTCTAENKSGYNSLPGNSKKHRNRNFRNKPKKVYGTTNTNE